MTYTDKFLTLADKAREWENSPAAHKLGYAASALTFPIWAGLDNANDTLAEQASMLPTDERYFTHGDDEFYRIAYDSIQCSINSDEQHDFLTKLGYRY